MMNHREVDLHTIIKNHQSKIHLLKQEIKIISDRSQSRIQEITRSFELQLEEKNSINQFLKDQIAKKHLLLHQEYSLSNSRHHQERDNHQKDSEKLKKKCIDLENKIQNLTEKYQIKIKEITDQNKKIKEKAFEQSQESSKVNYEIDKITKFYINAQTELPKRAQIIASVDHILELLKKSEHDEEANFKQLQILVKNTMESLKKDITHLIKSAIEMEDNINKEKQIILKTIRQISEENVKTFEKVLEENESFWQIIKRQKDQTKIELIKNLQSELREVKEQSKEEILQGQTKIKGLETERKTLLLGFTELKNLNENREKSYKQEIMNLKEIIEGLMQNNEIREKQSELQIKALMQQINQISQRYYDHIQIPISQINSKVQIELQKAKKQLEALQENKLFTKSIENLQNNIKAYCQNIEESNLINQKIINHVNKTQILLDKAIQHFQHQKQMAEYYGGEAYTYPNIEDTKLKTQQIQNINYQIQMIQNKEKENKMAYEMTTLKKHNLKLKEYCDSLEANMNQNLKNSSMNFRKHQPQPSPAKKKIQQQKGLIQSEIQINKKLIEMTVYADKLQSMNKQLSEEYLYQIEILKKMLQKVTGKSVKQSRGLATFEEAITKIDETNESLRDFIEREGQHMANMKKSMNILNNLLIKPVQTFEDLIYQVIEVQKNSLKLESHQKKVISSKINIDADKYKLIFQEIFTKRAEITTSSSKLINQLIKTVRDTFSLRQNAIKHQIHSENQNKLEKSQIKTKQNGLEKRIRDIQHQRIKSKEEVIKKIQKIQESLINIDHKYSKKYSGTNGKIEEIVDKKLTETIQKIVQNPKKGNKKEGQFSNACTSLIKDLKVKLKQSHLQNEGLLKEFSCLKILDEENEKEKEKRRKS